MKELIIGIGVGALWMALTFGIAETSLANGGPPFPTNFIMAGPLAAFVVGVFGIAVFVVDSIFVNIAKWYLDRASSKVKSQ